MPKISVDQHKKWFLALSEAEFINLARKWNQKNVGVDVPIKGDYDDYLGYFRTITPNKLKMLFKTGRDAMDIEAYAAVSRWVEIIAQPSKIEKIRKTKMAQETENDIQLIAVGDDDEAFYEALIQQNVRQLNSTSVSQQEVARLTSNINIFRKELRQIRSRSIRKNTVLARIMESADGVKPKAVRKSTKKPVKKKANGKKATTRQSSTKN